VARILVAAAHELQECAEHDGDPRARYSLFMLSNPEARTGGQQVDLVPATGMGQHLAGARELRLTTTGLAGFPRWKTCGSTRWPVASTGAFDPGDDQYLKPGAGCGRDAVIGVGGLGLLVGSLGFFVLSQLQGVHARAGSEPRRQQGRSPVWSGLAAIASRQRPAMARSIELWPVLFFKFSLFVIVISHSPAPLSQFGVRLYSVGEGEQTPYPCVPRTAYYTKTGNSTNITEAKYYQLFNIPGLT